jgi:hypothetical protein
MLCGAVRVIDDDLDSVKGLVFWILYLDEAVESSGSANVAVVGHVYRAQLFIFQLLTFV